MLFEAGPESAPFPVLHLWGTPYEMGVAQGTIMKEELRNFVTVLLLILVAAFKWFCCSYCGVCSPYMTCFIFINQSTHPS